MDKLYIPKSPVLSTKVQHGQVGQHQNVHKNPTNAFVASRRMAYTAFWMRFAHAQKLGELAERYVLMWLRSQGYIAKHTAQRKHQGDVTATDTRTGEIIHIEVKAARPDVESRYQYCIRKKGKTSAYHSDFVVMLAVDDYHTIYRYIVPIGFFGNVKIARISSHPTKYTGKFAPFLVRDDAIDLDDILTTYELIGD
ncbi:MAG: hypothetical protein AAFR81_04050 [Chloroflexota bacterium]